MVMQLEPGTDVLRARQLVQERVARVAARLPQLGRPPVILPPLSYQYKRSRSLLRHRNVDNWDAPVASERLNLFLADTELVQAIKGKMPWDTEEACCPRSITLRLGERGHDKGALNSLKVDPAVRDRDIMFGDE